MSSDRLHAIRTLLKESDVAAVLVPQSDMFMGEYIRPSDERLAWVSGFQGSAGFALISQDNAYLFVDSRYYLQAQKEVKAFEICLVPALKIRDIFPKGRIGYDPRFSTLAEIEALGDTKPITNPIDKLWHDRPSSKIFELHDYEDIAGEGYLNKIDRIRRKLTNVDAFISNSPESLAWILNIRGGEIDMVPAPHAIFYLDKQSFHLFGLKNFTLQRDIHLHELDELGIFLEQKQNTLIGFDETKMALDIVNTIQSKSAIEDPIIHEKAKKNAGEIKASLDAHIADGIAITRFMRWLDETPFAEIDEIKASSRLESFRKENKGYKGKSFDTISAMGANGAIVHYRVKDVSNKTFHNGIYLCDSGGHYQNATTDITRTIWIGKGDPEAKEAYRDVLEGLLCIQNTQFPKHTTGKELDALARQYLWKNNRDFGHGTGHGVGAELSVHEGPQSISKRAEVPLEAGMILSLEPGYYVDERFGIRLENLALVEEVGEYLRFQCLTMAPFDLRFLENVQLSSSLIENINAYHQLVWKKISDHLDLATKNWLYSRTFAFRDTQL